MGPMFHLLGIYDRWLTPASLGGRWVVTWRCASHRQEAEEAKRQQEEAQKLEVARQVVAQHLEEAQRQQVAQKVPTSPFTMLSNTSSPLGMQASNMPQPMLAQQLQQQQFQLQPNSISQVGRIGQSSFQTAPMQTGLMSQQQQFQQYQQSQLPMQYPQMCAQPQYQQGFPSSGSCGQPFQQQYQMLAQQQQQQAQLLQHQQMMMQAQMRQF
eukprot:g26894.t1